VNGQPHTSAALPQGKEPTYPLDRNVGPPQSQSGCSREENNFQLPPGIEPTNLIIQPVASHYTD